MWLDNLFLGIYLREIDISPHISKPMSIYSSMIYDSQLLNKFQRPLVVQRIVIIYYMIEFYLEIKGMKLQANVKTSLNFKRIRESQRSQSLHDLLYVKCGEWAEKAISSCLEVGKTQGRWEVIFLVQGFFMGMMDHGQIPVMVTQSREHTRCYEMVYLIQMNCKI